MSTWDDARAFGAHLTQRGWLFRGHTDAHWQLQPTLERAMAGRSMLPGVQSGGALERLIIRTFQSRAHHFTPNPPRLRERLEWLSLLQHYGGPTRLLDFTGSFYIAADFATAEYERQYNSAPDAAIWAINGGQVFAEFLKWFMAFDLEELVETQKGMPFSSKIKQICQSKRNGISTIKGIQFECTRLMSNLCLMGHVNEDVIVAIQPFRLNERLAIQQGWLALSLGGAFADVLCSTFDMPPNTLANSASRVVVPPGSAQAVIDGLQRDELFMDRGGVIKFTLPVSIQRAAVDDLRQMNISDASLFPGLDGFARSLYRQVATLDSYLPNDEWG